MNQSGDPALAGTEAQGEPPECDEELPSCAGNRALAQIAQRDCRVSLLEIFKNHVDSPVPWALEWSCLSRRLGQMTQLCV